MTEPRPLQQVLAETRRARHRATAEDRFLDIKVVVRTRAELAAVVKRNPLGKVVQDPKRYQVSFLDAAPKPEVVKRLSEAAVQPEEFAHIGRELYAWHPKGIARSKLWAQLASPRLGVTATERNWQRSRRSSSSPTSKGAFASVRTRGPRI